MTEKRFRLSKVGEDLFEHNKKKKYFIEFDADDGGVGLTLMNTLQELNFLFKANQRISERNDLLNAENKELKEKLAKIQKVMM